MVSTAPERVHSPRTDRVPSQRTRRRSGERGAKGEATTGAQHSPGCGRTKGPSRNCIIEKRRNDAVAAYAPLYVRPRASSSSSANGRTAKVERGAVGGWGSHSLLLLALPQHVLRHRDVREHAKACAERSQRERLVEEPAAANQRAGRRAGATTESTRTRRWCRVAPGTG